MPPLSDVLLALPLALALYVGFCLLWFAFFGLALQRFRFDDLGRVGTGDQPGLALWPSVPFLAAWLLAGGLRRRWRRRPIPAPCRACARPLLPGNWMVADGCPCNSPRGVNHGLVATGTCTCLECDPAQTGSTRPDAAAASQRPPAGARVHRTGVGPGGGVTVLCCRCDREEAATDRGLCVPCGLLQARLDEWDSDGPTVPDSRRPTA